MICDICQRNMVYIKEDLWICSDDGLISSHLKPNMTLYGKEYHDKHLKFLYNEVDLPLQVQRIKFVTDNVPEIKRGALLDVGSGNGSFLHKLDGLFAIKRGFDINPYENFTRIDSLLATYNVVTMWDVLEHLESPLGFLRDLHTEYVFITVPCIEDINVKDIFSWRHYRPYEHLHYYNLDSLMVLLKNAGYEYITHNYEESTIRKGGKEKNLISIGAKRK